MHGFHSRRDFHSSKTGAPLAVIVYFTTRSESVRGDGRAVGTTPATITVRRSPPRRHVTSQNSTHHPASATSRRRMYSPETEYIHRGQTRFSDPPPQTPHPGYLSARETAASSFWKLGLGLGWAS